MKNLRKIKKTINRGLTILLIVVTLTNLLPIPLASAQETSSTVEENILPLLPPINPDTMELQSSSLSQTVAAASANFKPVAKVHKLFKDTYQSSEKITTLLEQTTPGEITTTILDPAGTKVTPLVKKFKRNEFTVVEITPTAKFKPGKYTLKITTPTGTSTQEFSWGILVINPNKAVYKPEEKATLAMAVLDEVGDMVCDASVKLEIRNPQFETKTLKTEDGSIIVNPECTSTDFTMTPDYQADYQVGGVGTYQLTLQATTKNGTKTITDSFSASTEVPFEIERIAPTRIYPPQTYPVTLKVTATADFEGTIRDFVPASFDVYPREDPESLSYDSTGATSESVLHSQDVLGTSTGLGLPFKGNWEKTQGFGDVPDDPLLAAKYHQYGVVAHDGLDFALPSGTEVVSVADGKIAQAKIDGDYGTTIVVEHSWGKSYYGHLSKMEVLEETVVTRGQVLGLSGSTGLSTGPHLHFGIKLIQNDFNNGYFGKIDPSALILGGDSAQVLGVATENPEMLRSLGWNVSLKAGETISLGYSFKAPDISPQLHQLGLGRFYDPQGQIKYTEGRKWQVAADAIVVEGGIVASEAQFGGNQRKIAFVNSNWYAFYNDGTDVSYKKSANGTTWGGAVNLDQNEDNDADNYNPSIDVSGNFIHVFWLDESADQVQGVRLDTADDTTTQTTICGLTSPGAFTVSTYMVSVASLSASRAIVAYGDSTTGANVDVFDVINLDVVSCALTDVSPGNVPFGTQGSGITASVTNGNRPVLVGVDATTAMMVWRDNTNLKSALFNAASGDWTSPSTTIAAVTDTIYSATTDGTSVWVLGQNSTTGTHLYKCCTLDLNEQVLDSDAGGNGQDTTSEISMYCINSSDCKIVYTDDIDTTTPTLIFIDCGSDGAGGRDLAAADPHCTTKSTVTLDSDVTTAASANFTANPKIYCVASNNCKVLYADMAGANSPDVIFVDCADEVCTQATATFFTVNADYGGTGQIFYGSLDCVGGDANCKIVFNDAGAGDLSFIDCNASNCNSTTLIDLDIGAGAGAKNDMYCVASNDCKIVYHDVTTTDVVFINCGTAGTPETCATLSGDTTVLDATVSGTSGAVSVGVDCTGGGTADCKVIYTDDNATGGCGIANGLCFVDCGSNICASGTFTDVDLTGGANGAATPSVYLACISATDCKFTYVGEITSGSEKLYYVDCSAADCTTGSAYIIPGARTKGAVRCPATDDCKLAYYDGTSATQPTVQFGDCDSSTCMPTWTAPTAPWTSETNVSSVCLTYDSSNIDLIANIAKDVTNRQAYYNTSDATTISWTGSTAYDGFTAGDMDNMSCPETAAGTSEMGVFVRLGSNMEFDLFAAAPSGPTLDQTLRHGGWFSSGVEQPFTF